MSDNSNDYFELGVSGHTTNQCLNETIPFAIKRLSETISNPDNYLLKIPGVAAGIHYKEYYRHKLPTPNKKGVIEVILTNDTITNLFWGSLKNEVELVNDKLLITKLLYCYKGKIITENVMFLLEPKMQEFTFIIDINKHKF